MRFASCVLSFVFCITLLSTIPLLSAAYTDPPHDAVRTYDAAYVAAGMQGDFGGTLPHQTPTVEDPFNFYGGKLLSVLPSVNNRTSDGPKELLWVWIASYPPAIRGLTSEPVCPDEVELQFIQQSLNGQFTFTFRNESTTLPFDQSTPFLVPMPSMSSALASSNGSEPLRVDMTGTVAVTFQRTITTNLAGENGCHSLDSRTDNVTFSRSFSDGFGYVVEAGTPQLFLERPLLHEQYFRNNRFDGVLFARRQIYQGNVFLDQTLLGTTSFRQFDISTDEYGIQHIYSIAQHNVSGVSIAFYPGGFSSPSLLGSENSSFAYAFNTSYAGIGWHNLSLRARDDFGNEYNYTEALLSRDLPLPGGQGESGFPSGSALGYTRPSLPSVPVPFQLPIAFLGGVILILLLLRFRPQ